ncbi:hypothetical protein [Collinsella sp. An2]|uniref:hypothetical protein n=1 Tax=Collinsella sp. An2 TaxID=1965585 RepID=UPI000B36DBDC|nr:hypothetical protein [Collinsella sp. An2]OUP09125.1 hypothetical protein B5F33_05145 [Collinsella sp. An2]
MGEEKHKQAAYESVEHEGDEQLHGHAAEPVTDEPVETATDMTAEEHVQASDDTVAVDEVADDNRTASSDPAEGAVSPATDSEQDVPVQAAERVAEAESNTADELGTATEEHLEAIALKEHAPTAEAAADAHDGGSMPSWLQHPTAPGAANANDVIRHEGVDLPAPAAPGVDTQHHAASSHPERDVTAAAAEAANAVGTFFSEGAAAVRAMNAAKKAHAEAREQLDTLDRTIAEEEAELEHRRDVASRYHDIVTEQTARVKAAVKAISDAETKQKAIDATIQQLKEQLESMKADDAQAEKRLKATLDAAEAKEASAREASSRLKRRLDDAERNLAKAEEDKKNGIAAATTAAESAEARLKTLREEFAEVQRNPSANSAAYNVRANELEAQISDAMHELREARDGLPQLTAELDAAIASAKSLLAEAQKPIEAAKAEFENIREEADDARDAYETAKQESSERQRELREKVAEQEKARREQEQAASDARDEQAAAQLLIDEAEDIHAHPEVTDAIAGRLDADRAERIEVAREVEQLAAAEQNVREQTRSSRLRFTAVVAAIVVVILLLIILWLVLS